jgi:magnesium-transporting ATPase (P-type)
MVLADDNFATIVRFVREGRRIYDNIRRFVSYGLTGGSAEIWVMLLAPLFGLPLALLQLGVIYWPPAQAALDLQPLTLADLAIVLVASTATFWAIEAEKLAARLRARPN